MTNLSDKQDTHKVALEKRQHSIELAVINLDNSVNQLKFFKKQQIKLLCKDMDKLASFKGEFERKIEFMHDQF